MRHRFKNEHQNRKGLHNDNEPRHTHSERSENHSSSRYDQKYDRSDNKSSYKSSSNGNSNYEKSRNKRPKHSEESHKGQKTEIDNIFKKYETKYTDRQSEQPQKPSVLDRIKKIARPNREDARDSRKKRDNKHKFKSSRDYLDMDNGTLLILHNLKCIDSKHNRNNDASDESMPTSRFDRLYEAINHDPESNVTDNLLTLFDEDSDLPYYQPNHNNQAKKSESGRKNKKMKKKPKQNWSRDPVFKSELNRKHGRKRNIRW